MKNKKVMVVIAILTSIFLWVYIDTTDETSASTYITNIPIEYIGESDSLFSRNLMVVSRSGESVNLTLQGPRSVISKLNRNNLRVVVDLSSITAEGNQTLSYKITYPNSVSSSSVTVKSASLYSVTVDVEKMTNKTVDIKGVVKGTVAEGYTAKDFTLNPNTVVVYGQSEDVLQVAHAQVTMEIENADSSITRVLSIELIGYDNQILDISKYRFKTDTVIATLPIETVKTLPLKVNLIESAGSTNYAYEVTPKQITVSGDKTSLEAMDAIELGTIELHNLSSNTNTIKFSIPLPAGTECVSGEEEATVWVEFFDQDYITLEATKISCVKTPSNLTAVALTKSLRVTLRGPSEVIQNVKSDNVRIVADLSEGIEGKGLFHVPVTIYVDGFSDVGAINDYEITVRISG